MLKGGYTMSKNMNGLLIDRTDTGAADAELWSAPSDSEYDITSDESEAPRVPSAAVQRALGRVTEQMVRPPSPNENVNYEITAFNSQR